MALEKVPAAVQGVLQTLQTHGFEAVLVGGCVRDMLLSRPVHDYDIATNALPDEVVRLFDHTRDTGIKHGTVTILSDPICPVEVTTYRSEAGYSDKRHPDTVRFGATLFEDLSRRDFTVNAMAFTPSGRIVDPFGGQNDLLLKCIRAVGDSRERFREDSLRILRAVRFAAQLSFEVESTTRLAMTEASPGLSCVSKERIGQELTKIAKANWWQVIPLLADCKLLASLPDPLSGLQSDFDSLALVPDKSRENWRTLFSNADTQTFWLATWGTWLLFDNAPVHTVKKLFQELAIESRHAKPIGYIACAAKEELFNWPKSRWQESLFSNGQASVQIAARIRDGLILNQLVNYEALCTRYISEQPIWSRKDLAVTADDLIAYGLHGQKIGQAFKLLCQAVLSNKCKNTKTDLVDYLKKV
jgi:tRNA nucleotidyltransferase (CCA-adding enzyme)